MKTPRLRNAPLLLLLIGFGLFVFLAAFSHVTCVDIGFHIRTGAHILETGRIPRVNTFASTIPDHPWVLHQWWPGLLFYGVHAMGGLTGLIVLKCLLALLVMGLALGAAGHVTHWKSAWPFWAATCGVLLARSRFYERPFFISAALFAALLFLELRYRADRRWQWLGLPLLLAVWANTHAGVLYGVIYVLVQGGVSVLTAVLAARRSATPAPSPEGNDIAIRTVGVLLSGFAIWSSLAWINPWGIQAIASPIVYFLDPFWQSLIQEFRGITWANGRWFLVTCGVLATLQLLNRRSIPWHLAVPVLVFAVMTFRSRRCILFFVLAAIPYAAALLQAAAPSIGHIARKRHALYLFLLWTLLVSGVFVRDPNLRFGIGLYERLHPRGLYAFLDQHVTPQPLYNDMRYGADILWWLYPRFRPFIDGRCEAYPKSFWRDVYQVVERGDPAWENIFARYDIGGALVTADRGGAGRTLVHLLHEHPQWALVAFDDTTQLYLKRTPENAGAIADHEYRRLWPAAGNPANDAYASPALRREALRALAVAPYGKFAGLTAARCAFAQGDWAQAARLYERLLSLPGAAFSPAVHRYYAHALYEAGRLDPADRVFADLATQPGAAGAHAWYMRHYIAVRRRELGKAARFLAHAIAKDPGNEEYKARREQLARLRGHTTED